MRQAGMWDLGPFAAVLATGQMSPQTRKYQKSIWD